MIANSDSGVNSCMRWHEIVQESSKPGWFGLDNPGGEWLERAQEKCRTDPKGIRGNSTGYTKRPIKVLVDKLISVKGFNDEHTFRHLPGHKRDQLLKSVDEKGFDNREHPILVAINVDGQPYIMEGNHRTAVAHMESKPYIWANVQWYGGSEALEGEWSPATLQRDWETLQSRKAIDETFEAKKVEWKTFGPTGAAFNFTVGDQQFYGMFEPNSQIEGNFHFAFVSLANGRQTGSRVDNTGLQGPRSLQVFGYVVSALEEFLDKISPESVTFGADKAAGKDDLYMAMAKRLKPRAVSLGYRIAYEEKYGAGYFTLEKNN